MAGAVGRALLLLFGLWLPGCVASLPPPFRDLRTPDVWHLRLMLLLEEALKEAGWQVRPGPTPQSISTHPRTIAHLLLYRVEGYVELVPIDSHRVRLYVHAYRYYVLGRSRIGHLNAALSRRVAEPIGRALRKRGFEPVPYALRPITIE